MALISATDFKMKKPNRTLSPWRMTPLAVLALGAALFFGFGLDDILTFDALRDNRSLLTGYVEENTVLAAIIFMAVYAAAIVFVPPSGTVMTLAGGFVFGAVATTAYVVVAATVGATALFLAAKLSIGDVLHKRAGPWLHKMEGGFRENEMSYMLVLRLVPLFPFWLVNLAPAFLHVRLRTFVIGTFFGIIPGTAVYATVGAGLGGIFEADGEFSLAGVMTPEITAGLVGLGVLALIPVVYKKIKARKDAG